ncbi:hypothetical protein Q8G81_33690, partial [Klebsiella pneumoniae]
GVMLFCSTSFVAPLKNKTFSAPGKWKMDFPCIESENFPKQHCFPSQDTHMCGVQAHYNKLFHYCGYDLAHFP